MTRAIELDPKSAIAYINRGLAHLERQNLSNAIADSTRAIELNPKDAGFYYNRARAYLRTNECDKAMADINNAIRMNPKGSSLFQTRCAVHLAKKDYDLAIADAGEAIRLDPKNATAYAHRSEAHAAKRDHQKAIADATKAIESQFGTASGPTRVAPRPIAKRSNWTTPSLTARSAFGCRPGVPKLAEIYGTRARARQLQGKLDEAVADLTMAVMMDAKSADLRHQRAVVYEAKGDKTKAQQDFDQAKKLGFR